MISLLVLGPPFSTSSSWIIFDTQIFKFRHDFKVISKRKSTEALWEWHLCMVGYFAFNDQESKRWSSGDFSWISTGKVSVEVEG